MPRKLFVTTAPALRQRAVHIGHIMEYIQADIWVRSSACRATKSTSSAADDAHGAPIMLKAEAEGNHAEELVGRILCRPPARISTAFI